MDRPQAFETIFSCIDGNIHLDGYFDDYCEYFNTVYGLQAQSGEVTIGTNEMDKPVEQEQTIMGFVEAKNDYSTGFGTTPASNTLLDTTPDVGLQEYLSRPVEILNTTWNESDTVATVTSFRPWNLFFNTTSIKNKLNNYAFIRCNLKLKFMVNASPFYYGAMLVSYQPLDNFHDGGIPGYTTRNNILLSQRPHLWIYPQNNEGGELTLPFMWPLNMLPTSVLSNFTNMGIVYMNNVCPLLSANGVSGTGVSIVVYAWAEDVVISGPTCETILQSDEYDGPVSRVASAIATGSSYFSSIPIIGRFATATSIGASAISKIASMFGFTNTPVIKDTMPYKPSAFPVLASTEQGFPIEKLTIDAKNELTIDPGVAGLSSGDELSIRHMVGRESYLTQYTWSTSTNSNDILFSTAINPMTLDADGNANPTLFLTPMAWVASLFQYWRGDIIFRFKFICSQYHRGRVRISYDPQGTSSSNLYGTANTQSTVFNTVVDLTKDTNVEIRVPYSQAYAWCTAAIPSGQSSILWSTSATPSYNHSDGVTNGLLTVRCVTKLTAPVASSSIYCNVSVRGAENLEFAGPRTLSQNWSYFQAQSDEYDITENTTIVAGHAPSKPDSNRFLVNMGENVMSLRQLLHRYNYYYTANGSQTGDDAYFQWNFYRMPATPGYDPSGLDSAKGIVVTASNFNYNYCAFTTIAYLSAAFIGQRGSVNWSFNPISKNTLKHVSINRATSQPTVGTSTTSLTGGSKSKLARSYTWSTTLGFNALSGLNLTNQITQAGLNTSIPNYSQYIYNTTTPRNATGTISVDDTNLQINSLQIIWNGNDTSNNQDQLRVTAYIGAGVDFSLIFFLNVPAIYNYSSVPSGN